MKQSSLTIAQQKEDIIRKDQQINDGDRSLKEERKRGEELLTNVQKQQAQLHKLALQQETDQLYIEDYDR